MTQGSTSVDDESNTTLSAGISGGGPAASGARTSLRGFLWTTLSFGSNKVAVLGLTILLARLLTPADFGVVTAALTIITMLDAALDLGVGAAVVTAQERGITRRTRAAMTLNLAISALIAGIGIALSPWIAQLFDAAAYDSIFALLFCYPLFRGAGQISDAVLKRDLRFRQRTVVDVVRAVARVAVSVPLALTVGGPITIALGIVASEFAAMLLLWALVPIRPGRVDGPTARSLLSFGGQITVIRTLGSLRAGFDYLVVGAVLGATALGVYGMAYKLPELGIENILWIFSMVALPTYARALAVGRDTLISAMLRATRLLSIYGLGVGVALAVVARDAVPVIFSTQWDPAVLPMMLISVSLGLMSVGWASGDVFAVLGRLRVLLWLDIPATGVTIVMFVLAPTWGLIGVAAVHLVFNFAYAVARLALVHRVLDVRVAVLARTVAPALAVAATTAAVGFGARALLPTGGLGSLVLLSLATGAALAGASLIFARSELSGVVRSVLPDRPTRNRRAVVQRTG
ncbi:MAG: oligosaccharide flippase family protein [Microlunatus sp.]